MWKKLKDAIKVNRNLLPIKAHYFICVAAYAGVGPFLPLFSQTLGISAAAFGIINTLITITTVLTKPAICAIVDIFKKLKLILIVCTVASLASHLALLLIPAKNDYLPLPEINSMQLNCSNNQIKAVVSVNKDVSPVFKSTGSSHVCCELRCQQYLSLNNSLLEQDDILNNCSHFYGNNAALRLTAIATVDRNVSSSVKLTKNRIYSIGNDTNNTACACDKTLHCSSVCLLGNKHCPLTYNLYSEVSIYSAVQFWAFLILLLISQVSSTSGALLSDVVCYEMLADTPELFGRQRLWGTISWGIMALVNGYIMDVVSEGSNKDNYTTGFYLMAAFLALDLAIISKMKLINVKPSHHYLKGIKSVFRKPKFIYFLISVFLVGALSGLQWSYVLWYLKEKGASKLLLGLSLTVQCFLAEVPCFFIAGSIIKKIGITNAITLTFVAFAIRFFGYTGLGNLWWVLPIELTHGQTFGVFFAAITLYAKTCASPGTEATLQGITGVVFKGLGVSAGNLLGGLSYDKFGGLNTFLFAGIMSISFALLNMTVHLLFVWKDLKRNVNAYSREK